MACIRFSCPSGAIQRVWNPRIVCYWFAGGENPVGLYVIRSIKALFFSGANLVSLLPDSCGVAADLVLLRQRLRLR
jgi:hypothetical protein